MMQEYNTHIRTHTYVHMDILLLTVIFASIKAPASSSSLTALLSAARYGTADIVKLLLEAGALIEAKTTVSKKYPYAHVCGCLYSCIIVCMISKKCRFILFLYFIIVICRI